MFPSEYHFCTYFDRNYLTRGLVLYRSLARHCQRPFTLWVLCFDEMSYQTLDRLCLPGVRLISAEQFEAGDSDLQRAKTGRSRVEYYWTCTPSLPLYILDEYRRVDTITYLDADLCFYADPMPVYSDMGDGSILIVEHRYASEHTYQAAGSGVYNVGLMAFRRDARALACLRWWRERCLEWCYARSEDGRFGDQKYLDDWPLRFEGVVVLKHDGAGLAPWNACRYDLGWDGGRLTVDNAPLIYYHFHSLKGVAANVIQPAGYQYRLSSVLVEHLYLPYVDALRQAERDANVGASLPRGKRNGSLGLLPGLLVQRWLLVAPRWLAVLLWTFGAPAHDRLLRGLDAFRNGDLLAARRMCLLAAFRTPWLVVDRETVSLLARMSLKPGQMSFLRRLRGRTLWSG